MGCVLILVLLIAIAANSETLSDNSQISKLFDVPKFAEPITNVTMPVGREATLVCVVDDLSSYKVAWLRVDTQTILTIHSHVITKNHRIGVSHSDHRTWYLHIKEIRETDRGWYMCQINTDPMKSQVGFLDVVVPPDILDNETSTDMVVRENSNVAFKCAARGSPPPAITWRREGGQKIQTGNGEVACIDGPSFNITKVNRLHMGAYLCIASNGVPPSVSKRISLIVHFPPMVWIPDQLVGVAEGQEITLECHSEAYPKSINYWTKDKGDIIAHGAKYEPVLVDNAYKVHMKLTIRAVSEQDYGSYKCVAKNSLGDTDGTIKVYSLPHTTSRPKHKDKGRNRKYGPNDIDPGLSAKQRELKQGRYDEDLDSGTSQFRWSSTFLVLATVLALL
ncbi:lachesin isoform X2 [Halyomorpha halys]|uniref:lachesin isoform X2 n=1 Tax=Halyomorpha halys TaxID=286706 RepID=UPI0006D4FAF2